MEMAKPYMRYQGYGGKMEMAKPYMRYQGYWQDGDGKAIHEISGLLARWRWQSHT